MEYTIGLIITGSFILLVTLYRVRNVSQYRGLEHKLKDTHDVANLDLSGNTRYASCFSHQWVIDNITKRSHSRLGAMLQDHLANNTLLAGIWIGLIVGTSSMLLTMIFVQSLRAIGTVIVIFILGVMIALGPGGPRYSESLLDAVMKQDFDQLNAQDYVYVKISNDTIKRAVMINLVLATVFIGISPWGDMLPIWLAQVIAFFTVNVIWNPAEVLMGINVGVALFYIGAIIGIFSFVCFKIGQAVLADEEEEPRTQY